MSVDDFYRYADTRLYAKCKKCHNRTRNKYERKRDRVDRAPSAGGSTIMMTEEPNGEKKFFVFDFINMACRALGEAELDVQTNVTSGNTNEVKIGSSGSTPSA